MLRVPRMRSVSWWLRRLRERASPGHQDCSWPQAWSTPRAWSSVIRRTSRTAGASGGLEVVDAHGVAGQDGGRRLVVGHEPGDGAGVGGDAGDAWPVGAE